MSASNDIADRAVASLGRTPDNPELAAFLKSLNASPPPPFEPDEFMSTFRDKDAGYELQFHDASTVEDPRTAGLKPRTLVLASVFFYSGKKDDYAEFKGALPHGMKWSDTPESLVAKLGAPEATAQYKKTGTMKIQRWKVSTGSLSATYMQEGPLGMISFVMF